MCLGLHSKALRGPENRSPFWDVLGGTTISGPFWGAATRPPRPQPGAAGLSAEVNQSPVNAYPPPKPGAAVPAVSPDQLGFRAVVDTGAVAALPLSRATDQEQKSDSATTEPLRCLDLRGCPSRDAGQSQTLRSTRTVRIRNGDGLLQLPLTSVDVLHDLMRDAFGITDLPANFDEARPGQHFG